METEEQQLEELKRWWKEHGRTVIAGVVLGIGTVVGWTSWRAHVDAKAEELSVRYEELVNTAAVPDYAGAVQLTDAIIADHPDSSYAGLAALVGAHGAYKSGDRATARRLLEWATSRTGAFQVGDVARVRLARILSEEGEHDAALALLDQVSGQPFAAVTAETRGDVLVARDDLAQARAAYESALATDGVSSGARDRIQLKLDALASRGG